MNGEEITATVHGGVVVELPLGDAARTFNLERAICSHGLFMTAPNHWDPQSKTFQRPLRLDNDQETSYLVQISHPAHSPSTLCLTVFGIDSLSPHQSLALLCQVRRMLRLSVGENAMVKEFHEVHNEAKERGFGRVFRSPTLFEDMIKCMLFCNCQWSRTLSMAEALCELQLELQQPSCTVLSKSENGISSCETTETEKIIPKTPSGKESKRKTRTSKCSKNLANKLPETIQPEDTGMATDNILDAKEGLVKNYESLPIMSNVHKEITSVVNDLKPIKGTVFPSIRTGCFPSPKELASLDEKFLAKRCNLGYRAGRVINLAKEVVEGRIDLREFESASAAPRLPDYENLAEKLRAVNGFGPFTCANVLMCMGFYHVVPSDSETIRHLKQVHAKNSTIKTVRDDVEVIYGKYAPFQFLAYWSEVWHFYEEWFGKSSEMPRSDYKLITAANMRPKTKNTPKTKRIKLPMVNMHQDLTEGREL